MNERKIMKTSGDFYSVLVVLGVVTATSLSSLGDESIRVGQVVESADGKASAAFSPTGKIKLTKADGTSRMLDHCSAVAGAFSPDGTLFCAAGQRPGGMGVFRVWPTIDGVVIGNLTSGMPEIPKIVFSTDNRLLACTTGKTGIEVWEIAEQKLKWSKYFNRPVASVAFNPADLAVIVTCSDKSQRRIQIDNGEVLDSKAVKSEVLCALLTPRP
jgi:WD40 repeat protein